MTYMERRVKLANLMAEAARVIRDEPDAHSRALLIERCADEVQECLVTGAELPATILTDCFVESVERVLPHVAPGFSVRVASVPSCGVGSHLRLVEDE